MNIGSVGDSLLKGINPGSQIKDAITGINNNPMLEADKQITDVNETIKEMGKHIFIYIIPHKGED